MSQEITFKDDEEPRMEDLTEYVTKTGHGVKGLSEMDLNNLPKQYIQPQSERPSSMKIKETDGVEESSIPIIDLSKWEDPWVANSICDAAEKWGFFQIVNHGVPVEVLEDVKQATLAFFGLPPDEKKKYFKENSVSNHVRLSTSFIPEAENALEWKDYLSLFYVSDDEALALWPSACRDQLLNYMRKCEVVIKPLVEALMKGLSIDEINETKWTQLTGSKRINLNYYPKCPKPELTVGVGRHSDVSTFTILLQDDIGGLYVRAPDGESWVHVPPIAGALVINVGDALQILSNGRYKSIEHRVIANGTKDRISIPLFVNPKPSEVIGPLEEVLENTGEKPKYKNVLYSDYTLCFYRKAHDGKGTLDFAKI
ncbi:feruloyl CoA ortho-hydroxylase F6H1-3 [Silene latifolia]|uniref:feruloyl CoA ortho-hydroxylase F6H1-3 n=1 Tax=Silene latifolia TaxID=37657 RepID=UPI003D76C65E